jgi:uncharacterized membrane protein YkvA (DUF1232 family)
MRPVWLIHRFMQFRDDLVRLWRAFLDPRTPFWLKAAMVGTVLYLFSPIDLLPDFLLGLGLVDDLIIVPLLLSWIARHLPGEPAGPHEGPTVEGTARRM